MLDKAINKELFFLKMYLKHYELLSNAITDKEKNECAKIKEEIKNIELQNKLEGF